MDLARSTYYYQPKGRARADEAALRQRIEGLCAEFPRYGYRRVSAQLRHEGWRVNHKRVSRLMRVLGLCVKSRARYVRTTTSRPEGPFFPNLAAECRPEGPDQLWITDITYVRVRSGFIYLAVLLDAWSRRVIGYALSRHIDVQLCLAALRAAIANRRPPAGCIHHSDRGSQYAAAEYQAVLHQHGLRGSMSRRGNPYDNARAESFMKTLKHEEVYLNEYQSFEDAVAALPVFLEQVYNQKRLHSALGYLSPVVYERQHARTAA